MHIWYDIEGKDSYKKKLHRTIIITILIPIFIVILFSILLMVNRGVPLSSNSSLYIISVIIFILFFVGIGFFSGIRSIQSNILKFIFVRTIHNKLLVLHIQEPGFVNLLGRTFFNNRINHNIVSQVRGAVQNLQNIDTTQQMLDSLGNLHILYDIETGIAPYDNFGWEIEKVLRISNHFFYYHIIYQAKREDRNFTTSINIPKNYPGIDQLLYIFKQKEN